MKLIRNFCFFSLGLGMAVCASAQVQPNLVAGMQWRNIGPFRAGRVAAVTGVIGQPGVYYIGLPGGGIWKTDSAGETWFPISDAVTAISSIGAIEVAPSDPNIIYAGGGDLITGGAINEGDGMYKSSDAGKTWQHLGLEDTRQIDTILVDPKNPDLVLIAAQGDVHAKTESGRGIYRSTDGGMNWKQVFVKDDTTGIQDIAWAFDQPRVLLATTVRHYNAPAVNGVAAAPAGGGRGGAPDGSTAIYKSTDEGLTWTPLQGAGLPPLAGRTSVAIAAHTNAQRMFLVGTFGLYRSDDGGANWAKTTSDTRITGSSYICDVYVDTQNPDIVFNMNTSTYRSTDGGKTFVSYKGAPGGDDNHVMWMDPTDHNRILLGTDQGATISFNGGHTWSSWYNQPTAQVYHISVDNRFPYWVYASQQDSGSVATKSRGDFGEITPLDWWPVAAYEFGYIVSDPTDPNIVYGGGPGGGLVKIVQPTGNWMNIAPNQGRTDLRKVTSPPVVFSPQDPHTLYYAMQYVMMTHDGGQHWTKISPDLSARPGAPAPAPGGRGGSAIESLAVSPVKAGVMWAGSNNGLVHLTVDGGAHWSDITPPGTPTYGDIAILEASHFDAGTAYAVIDQHAAGDYAPHMLRTRDYGKTWQPIVNGLPTGERSGSFARVVREDTVRKGLLYAGTESSMYVSFDDGDHWQSLRLNLPTTSYRDLVVHGNDLVAGTYGRSFYVLDDLSPLRQISERIASQPVYLFKPGEAIRTRYNVNGDTPLTPEVPHADNPPYGALLYYYLAAPPRGPVKIEILDAQQHVIRTMSSTPAPAIVVPPQPIPDYWMEQPQPLPAQTGTNRAVWDFRFDRPDALSHAYEQVDTVYEATPLSPQGPLALPGTYTVRLTVNGQVLTQPLTVVEDPRIAKTPGLMAALRTQLNLETKTVAGLNASYAAYQQVTALREQIKQLAAQSLPAQASQALTTLDTKLAPVQGPAGGRRGGGAPAAAAGRGAAPAPAPGFGAINGTFGSLLNTISVADMEPTEAQTTAYGQYCGDLSQALTTWRSINAQDLPALNATLAKSGAAPLATATVPAALACAPTATPARR